jgi:phage shock protein A
MSLFTRVNDIITANINDLVDRFEDPEKGLKQAIREMEEAIQTATSETAKVLASQKRIEKELSRNELEIASSNARAEQCVDASDDDGAREALKHASAAEKCVGAMREQLSAASAASDTLKEQLQGMRSKLDEAKRNLATLVARKKAADVRRQAIEATSQATDVALENSAFEKFDRLREKVEIAEAEAEAM